MSQNIQIISGLLLATFGMVAFVLMLITGFITGIISGSIAIGLIAVVVVGIYLLGSIPGLKFFRSRIFIGMVIVSGLIGIYQRLPEIVANIQEEGDRYISNQSLESLRDKEEKVLVLVKEGTPLYKRGKNNVMTFDKKLEKDLFCRMTEKLISDNVRYIELKFPKIDKGIYMENIFDESSPSWAILASDYEKNLSDIKFAEARAKAEAEAKERADVEAKNKALEKIRQDASRQEEERKARAEAEARAKAAMGTEVVLVPVEDNGRYRQYRLPVNTQLGDDFVLKEAIASRGFIFVFVGNNKKGEYPKKIIPAKTVIKIDEFCNRKSDGSFYLSISSDYEILTNSKIVVYHKKKGGA